MKTAQFYKYATWLLLALNLLVIAFFFFTQPGPPRGKHRQHFRKEALNILQLSNEQKAAFVASADTHNKAMNTLGEQENSLLKKECYRPTHSILFLECKHRYLSLYNNMS